MDSNPIKPIIHKKNRTEECEGIPPKKKSTGHRFALIPRWAVELLNKYEKIGDDAND